MRKQFIGVMALALSLITYQKANCVTKFLKMPSLPSTAKNPAIKARSVTLGNKENLYALDSASNIWKWNNNTSLWGKIPSPKDSGIKSFGIHQIAVSGSGGNLYAVNHSIYKTDIEPTTIHSHIDYYKGTDAWQILQWNGTMWKALNNYPGYFYKDSNSLRVYGNIPFDHTPRGIPNIAVGKKNDLYISISAQRGIMQWVRDSAWQWFPTVHNGGFVFLDAASDGTFAALNPKGELFINFFYSKNYKKYIHSKMRVSSAWQQPVYPGGRVTAAYLRNGITAGNVHHVYAILPDGRAAKFHVHSGFTPISNEKFWGISAGSDGELVGIEKGSNNILRMRK